MGEQARWNLSVSRELDLNLRTFLAGRGGKKGDLSGFVEQAVSGALLRLTVDDVWSQNRERDPDEIERVVAEEIKAFREDYPLDRNSWTRK